MTTELLQKVIATVESLPTEEQNIVLQRWLTELETNKIEQSSQLDIKLSELLLLPQVEFLDKQEWLYLVKRPHQWRKQLYIKGRKLLASTVWQDLIINQMSKEEASVNWNLPLAVIEEVICYCENHQNLIKLEAEEEGYRLQEKGVYFES